MPGIPDHSIDMILADLPYGITACEWDTIIPFAPLWQQYKRLIKPHGAVVLFGSQPFTSLLVTSNLMWFRYSWVWQKSVATNFLDVARKPLKEHEDILIFAEGSIGTYNPQKTVAKQRVRHQSKGDEQGSVYGKHHADYIQNNNGQAYPRTIIHFTDQVRHDSTKKNALGHPTQKPVSLFAYLVRTYTNENELVLDNCIGSGTTAVACIENNRNFIGIEKRADYCEIARERIAKVRLQPRLPLILKEEFKSIPFVGF